MENGLNSIQQASPTGKALRSTQDSIELVQHNKSHTVEDLRSTHHKSLIILSVVIICTIVIYYLYLNYIIDNYCDNENTNCDSPIINEISNLESHNRAHFKKLVVNLVDEDKKSYQKKRDKISDAMKSTVFSTLLLAVVKNEYHNSPLLIGAFVGNISSTVSKIFFS